MTKKKSTTLEGDLITANDTDGEEVLVAGMKRTLAQFKKQNAKLEEALDESPKGTKTKTYEINAPARRKHAPARKEPHWERLSEGRFLEIETRLIEGFS